MKTILEQQIKKIIASLEKSDVEFGLVKIGHEINRPENADETWDYKYNPHYHLMGAKSAIVVLYPYQLVKSTVPNDSTKLASIGYHADYHLVLYRYLQTLAEAIKSIVGHFDYKIFVDKHGLDDVKFALEAGLGQVAKNSMLLNDQFGTAHNIGYILSTLKIVTEPNILPIISLDDYCLNCNRCEVACPNGALRDRTVLLSRCRSSINQKKGVITATEIDLLGDWFYGCDICQYACPHNDVKLVSDDMVDLNEIMELTKSTFKDYHKTKSYGYLGLTRLKRNAMVLLAKRFGIAALEPYRTIIARSPLLTEQYNLLKGIKNNVL